MHKTIIPAPFRKPALALLASLFLALTLLAPPPAQAASNFQGSASCSSAGVALEAGRAFLSAAHTGRASDFAAALDHYADMRHISLFALGRYRRQLPANRVNEFVSLTSAYVARTLADFARKFRANSIQLIDCRGNQVATRLNLGARPAKRATWRISGGKVIDVNVQNVWLAQLLRDNFTSILQQARGSMAILFSHIGAPAPRQVGVN